MAPRIGFRPRRRTILVVGAAAVLVAAVVVGWRWRADRAYIGTDRAVELTWGECLNGIFWTDPDTGVRWWAGHDLVVQGRYESEPLRLHPPAAPPRPGSPVVRTVSHHSVGAIHFDAYDQATFTSRTGGTMQLVRPDPGRGFTADCVGGIGQFPGAGSSAPAPAIYAVALIGGLVGPTPVADAHGGFVLLPGTTRAVVDGRTVAETTTDMGLYTLYVPALGTITVEGETAAGPCAPSTIFVVSGVPDPIDLTCPT